MKFFFESTLSANQIPEVYLISEKLDFPSEVNKLASQASINLASLAKQLFFSGKKGEHFSTVINGTLHVFFGIGKRSLLSLEEIVQLGSKFYNIITSYKVQKTMIHMDSFLLSNIEASDIVSHFAFGIKLKSYRFDKYKTKLKPEELPRLQEIHFITEHAKESAKAWKIQEEIANSIYLTRDLISEPPNVIYPESIEAKCLELKKLGLEIEVLDEEKMQNLGMNALLGVGQGSKKQSRVIVMQYKGGPKNSKPIAFLGKGVTFDTGGISLKPSNGMEDMKYDMAGSAVVIGLLRTLAARKAKVNAIGVIGLVENMPDGNAQRPSDVVTSMSGQTIEVVNTDAEGRLVLADILWYCQDRYKPEFMINLATLTGAIVVALGTHHAGLFSNNDELAEKLLASGKKVSEKLWRMPIGEEYDRQINSPIADMQNVGNEKGAGSITAAQFLHRFVNNTPWAHIDIAGVTWAHKELDTSPKGPTAFGVRLLNQLVADYYEK